MTLEQIADLLDGAARYGKWADRKNGARLGAMTAAGAPEAAPTDRYVKLSDSVAREISQTLRRLAKGESPRGVAVEHR